MPFGRHPSAEHWLLNIHWIQFCAPFLPALLTVKGLQSLLASGLIVTSSYALAPLLLQR